MTITDIITIPNAKSRYRIYVDEEFAFVLYKGELSLFDIAVGNELSLASFNEITANLLPRRAKMRSFYLLKDRSYTEKQLRDKLSKGEYPPAIIDETIEYLKAQKYIDDEQYARNYIDYHFRDKSQNRIRQDLFKRGIPSEITGVIYSEIAGANLADLADIE